MAGIEISQAQIERWIQDGLKSGIEAMLRGSYGQGAQLQASAKAAIAASEPLVTEALKAGIAQACVSPAFLQTIEREVSASLASQYRGAFDGVIKAAAKSAANNEVVARRVAELTRQAAGLGPTP